MKRIVSLLLIVTFAFTMIGCERETPNPNMCEDDQELKNGVCVDKEPNPIVCEDDQELQDGVCVDKEPNPIVCEDDQVENDGVCVDIVDIVLHVNVESLTLIEGEGYEIMPVTNDELGVSFSVDAAGIITLSSEGHILAKNEGVVTITVTSLSDREVFKTIEVIVRKEITLLSNLVEINLEEEQTHQLIITSNDDYEFDVVNSEIIHVDETGLVTALNEGTTTITVTSTYDPSKIVNITVNVSKLINLTIEKDEYVLVVGDNASIVATSNDALSYISGDQNIVTVDDQGMLEAIGFGTTTVQIRSQYNPEVFDTISVTVFKYTESVSIIAPDKIANGTTTQLGVTVSPVGSFDEVFWESVDPTIASIDEEGNITAHSPGSVDVIAKSVLDETIFDTFTIEIINILVVDDDATTGSIFEYDGVTLQYGVQLFSSIADAMANAIENTVIYIDEGSYTGDFSVMMDGIHLISINGESIIDGGITLGGTDILIQGLTFNGNSTISNSGSLSNFVFIENEVTALNQSFMIFTDLNNIEISNSIFNSVNGTILTINGTIAGNIIIEENEFGLSTEGIKFNQLISVDIDTVVKIFFNTFDQIDTVFVVDFEVAGIESEIFKAARFNKVKSYITAVSSNVGSTFDFTLNYWDNMIETVFVNVDEHYVKGSYETEAEVLTKATYNPTLPITITILNPITEIMIGESHTFEYEILPYELSDAPVHFITGNPSVVAINQTGTITPLISGDVYIQVRSAVVSSIRTQTDFSIITTPGIELTPSKVENDLIVGESITLDYLLFPYTIENESVVYSSDNGSVATITQEGVVSTHSSGLATLKVALATDGEVFTEYTIMVYDSLDMSDPLDYITSKQVSFSTVHNWIAYGFQYNYNDTRAESVSRYYFDSVVINDTKMVPVDSYGIRPTELMDPLPDDVIGFNEDNIYWVVVHDTASTATGSDAVAHANYLYNAAIAGTPLWTSWHYSIDDHDIYQSLPENERGYHAGDGSTSPGEGTYLGGGNRNGIGIEMAINDDGDMYRTWQRTAKLVVDILNRNNLPISQFKYHNDFSGKDCPNTLRNAGLIPLFEEFVEIEYHVSNTFADSVFTFTSHNPDILDDHGRIIAIPQRATTVSYTIEVTTNGVTEARTFYTYVPGTVR